VGNGIPKGPLPPPPPPPPPLGADPNGEALKRVEKEMTQVVNEPKYTADERIGLMGELQCRMNTLDQFVHPKEPIPPLVPEPVPVKDETPAPPQAPPAPSAAEPESEPEPEPEFVLKNYPSSVVKRFELLTSEASEAVPPNSKNDVQKFIRKLQGCQAVFSVSKTGEFMYKHRSIKGSDMSDLVSSLFTGNPPKNDKGLQELIDGLTEARIPLPRGDHPKPKVEEEKEKSPGKRKRKSKKRDSQEGYERQQVGNGPPGKRIKLEFLYKR